MKSFIYIVFLLSFCNCEADQGIIENDRLQNLVTIKLDTIQEPIKSNIIYTTVLKSGFLNRQYSFSSTIKLNDGSLFMSGVSWEKFDDLNNDTKIIGVKSIDEGLTWSEPEVLQENLATINVANPSLVKISDQHLLLFFSSKESTSHINIYFKESFDQGKTWSKPKIINQYNSGYYIINNGRVVYENNRLWVPVAVPNGDIYQNYNSQKVFCFYSDDLGKTWQQTVSLVKDFALMEPCLTVLSDTELLLNIRTQKGKILFARSHNNGISWNFEYSNIKSPAAPQTIVKKKDSDILYMAWNNTDFNYEKSGGNRTPLTFAYSKDKGYNWHFIANIETSKDFSFSYPSILLDANDVYLSYYEVNNINYRSSIKFVKISF
ncbi:sialidase family protein [Flavobacterium adhaerens]|uniref:sialidase family protein n=1 Tax=Flavobacterium adhaerens TaxID=3149043 RepID=UPI0032B5ADD5